MLSEEEFRRHSEHSVEALKQALIALEAEGGYEVEENNGALNVLFEAPAGKFVITPNTPVRQVWISAPLYLVQAGVERRKGRFRAAENGGSIAAPDRATHPAAYAVVASARYLLAGGLWPAPPSASRTPSPRPTARRTFPEKSRRVMRQTEGGGAVCCSVTARGDNLGHFLQGIRVDGSEHVHQDQQIAKGTRRLGRRGHVHHLRDQLVTSPEESAQKFERPCFVQRLKRPQRVQNCFRILLRRLA